MSLKRLTVAVAIAMAASNLCAGGAYAADADNVLDADAMPEIKFELEKQPFSEYQGGRSH